MDINDVGSLKVVNWGDKSEEHPLIAAIYDGNIDIVKELIKKEDNLNFICPASGQTPLECAVELADFDIVKLLIKKGASVNAGFTKPLRVAIDDEYRFIENINKNISEKDYTEIALYIIDNDLKVNAVLDDGETYLINAVCNGRLDIVKVLIEKGALPDTLDNDGWPAIVFAASEGHKDIYEYLKPLSDKKYVKQAKKELKSGLEYKKRRKSVVEKIVNDIYEDKTDQLKKHIDKCSNLDDFDSIGNTPLTVAVVNSKFDVVKKLVKSGASINKKDEKGWSPLMWAVAKNDIKMADRLIKLGANISIKGKKNKSIIFLAAERSTVDMLKILIERGADANSTDEKGKMPIDYAAKEGKIDNVEYLATFIKDNKIIKAALKKAKNKAEEKEQNLKKFNKFLGELSDTEVS